MKTTQYSYLSGRSNLIIPWKVDVPQDRLPFINWLIIAGVIAAFALQIASIINQSVRLRNSFEDYKKRSVEEVAEEFGVGEQELKKIEQSIGTKGGNIHDGQLPTNLKDQRIKERILEEYFIMGKIRPFILNGWTIKGLFGHIWLHGDIIHLLGNMLFLWIFGNAVCAKIGNVRYLPIYLGLGFIAGISHLVFTGGSVLGASGAIYGIVGMYLVFFPENEITCYYAFPSLFTAKEFCVSSIWMILFWVVFDIWGAMKGGGGVAYFAHLGGFAAGFVLAIVMLKLKLVVMDENYEKSLLQLIAGRKGPAAYESTPQYIRHAGLSEKDLETIKPETAEPAEMPTIPLEPEPPREEFIRFACSCGKRLKIPTKYAGKTGVCPKCKLRVRIPEK
jgi:membrane associated rhomboid family serine protease